MFWGKFGGNIEKSTSFLPLLSGWRFPLNERLEDGGFEPLNVSRWPSRFYHISRVCPPRLSGKAKRPVGSVLPVGLPQLSRCKGTHISRPGKIFLSAMQEEQG